MRVRVRVKVRASVGVGVKVRSRVRVRVGVGAGPTQEAGRRRGLAAARLQRYVLRAATVRDAGCNRTWRSLQPYATTLCISDVPPRVVPPRPALRHCGRPCTARRARGAAPASYTVAACSTYGCRQSRQSAGSSAIHMVCICIWHVHGVCSSSSACCAAAGRARASVRKRRQSIDGCRRGARIACLQPAST